MKEDLIRIMMSHGFYIESSNCGNYENESVYK